MTEPSLTDMSAFIMDMDGVLYVGNRVMPGAATFVTELRVAGIPHLFLTNNATVPPARVADRLIAMGVPATPELVVTSAMVTASVLSREMPGCRVYVIGEAGMREALVSQGFTLAQNHLEAELVIVSLDRQFTYAKLREATLAIRRGVPFVATNADRTLVTEAGLVPGTGTMVAAVQLATDVEPRIIGKPQPTMFQYALEHLGSCATLTAAIGDRPETDVVGAQRAGLRTIGVLTGIGTPQDFAGMQPPADWVFPDLVALRRAYFGN